MRANMRMRSSPNSAAIRQLLGGFCILPNHIPVFLVFHFFLVPYSVPVVAPGVFYFPFARTNTCMASDIPVGFSCMLSWTDRIPPETFQNFGKLLILAFD